MTDRLRGDGIGEDDCDPRDEDPTTVAVVEEAVMIASALFTLALFGFAIWQALAGGGAVEPTVAVVDSHAGAGDRVVYDIELRNEGEPGLTLVTVQARCASPPIELTFQNVPAGGYRRGSIACPPGTTDPRLSVVTWVTE